MTPVAEGPECAAANCQPTTKGAMKELTLELLAKAISQNDSALRLRLKLEPVGGAGDKVFPPTYEGSSYAVEERLADGRAVKAVLLNSVQSEAARLEQALKRALERDDVYFPTIRLELDGYPSLTELDLDRKSTRLNSS